MPRTARPTRPTRSTRLAGLAVAAALVLAPAASATVSATSTPVAPADRPAAPVGPGPAGTTKLVLEVRGCGGCSFQASSYHQVGVDVRTWSSRERTPDARGRVAFLVPTAYTRGLSVAVRAPWERRAGAVSQLVFEYGGDSPGDRVTVADARSSRLGNACFRGTRERRLVLGVQGYRAHVEGTGARATAAAAFTTTAQPVRYYDYPVADGWSGAQEVPCFPS